MDKKALCVFLLVTMLFGFSPITALSNPPDPSEKKIADISQAKLDLARKMYERTLELESKNATGVLPESRYLWSRRWLESQVELAKNKKEIIASYKAHLGRMKDLVGKLTEASAKMSAEYYVLEAELWVARAIRKGS
jgi:hypothetical protein